MRGRRRILISFFVLALAVFRLKAQDALSSGPVIDRSMSFVELEGLDSKVAHTGDQSEEVNEQRWSFHVQGTEIVQGQPGFHSPYAGINSLRSEDTFIQS
jgi:hypothetical protein